MARAVPIPFTTWLKPYARRDTLIGDLARDLGSDYRCPIHGDIQAYKTYLANKDAPPLAFKALEQAWSRYKTGGNRR